MGDIVAACAALHSALGGGALHPTKLAAACLRAVDPQELNAAFASTEAKNAYRAAKDAAFKILLHPGGSGARLTTDQLRALSQVWPPASTRPNDLAAVVGWSQARKDMIAARAIAQALHETRSQHFWSFFAGWTGERLLEPGDPVPVPYMPTLPQIFSPPLRLSPDPDSRNTPHGLCPGGYRGLPSLRLMPEIRDADVYLDPRVPRTVSPMLRGRVAVVIPADHLGARFRIVPREVEGETVFERAIDPSGVDDLIACVLGQLKGRKDATIAILPELTSTPEVDRAVGEAMAREELGTLQLVITGSSWIEPKGAGEPSANRIAIWGRDGMAAHHAKYSWYHDRAGAGAEHITHGRKRITIFAGPHLTFTTLVCKDALETWIGPALAEMRVRLVLVPSCNVGVSTYRPVATTLADLGQSTMVLANIPPDAASPRQYALSSRPAKVVSKQVPGEIDFVQPDDGYKPLILLNVFSAD